MKSFSDRTNIKHSWVGEHRIVSTSAGDMAPLKRLNLGGIFLRPIAS